LAIALPAQISWHDSIAQVALMSFSNLITITVASHRGKIKLEISAYTVGMRAMVLIFLAAVVVA